MAYRDEVEALAARHAALSAQLERNKGEVDEAARLLAQARARAKLSVLDNIHIATPCPAEWNDMSGDDRVRACDACNKNVYNISQLTRAEAEALIIAKEGRLCGRYYQRKDGTILLKDCMITIDKRGRRRWVALGASALLAGSALAAQGRVPAQHLTFATQDDAPRAAHFTSVPEVKRRKKAPRVVYIDNVEYTATGGAMVSYSEYHNAISR